MVRDRLEELKKKTGQLGSNYRSRDTSIQLEENRLKDVFQLAEQIGEGIVRINGNIEVCRRYMRQISESPYQEKDLSDKLAEIFQETGKLTHRLNYMLKNLEDQVKTRNQTCTVGRIEMVQYNTLKIRFKECLNKNNEQMEIFRNRRINNYKAQLRVKGIQVSEEEFSEILSGSQQIFNENILLETAEAKRLLSEAEELNEQLLKIEHLITEVKDLFVQMSILVEEQQELIDVVEYQTQKAVEYVYQTPNILREAEKKKHESNVLQYYIHSDFFDHSILHIYVINLI
ncbi:syntaxin-1A-like isoform X2 [Harmonia axyridis]|uniref:syntaxin-1A-like isoform X2 n=1 Tax=Harmonia axyridis TaxID=115357 RepID=UPI001E2781AF|nr:syntaxin-1A-like isoform X2 [Harmonia axyridis]